MPILKSLTLVATDVAADPVVTRRANLVSQLEQQKALVLDPGLTRGVSVWRANEVGQKERVQLSKPVRPWWTKDAQGRILFRIRYGRRSIELEKGKAGIVVPSKEELPKVLDLILEAVTRGELDDLLASLARSRLSVKSKDAATPTTRSGATKR
jgi:hypothetical protein